MMEEAILEFQHITKKYPGTIALDDVSISFLPGEVHALCGENGAGKSTLIKTCSGAISPTSGKILIEGREFDSLTDRLQTTETARRRFVSDASHELKTPLTVILSNAALLEAAPLEERPARWTDNICSEAQRMKALVEEMLTLARADNMTHTAVLTEISLSDIAAGCALAFEPVAFEAGKPLEYHVTEGVTVLGDGDKLRRLLSILLDNAVKYGAEGGTITLALEKTDRQARLTVTNPGEPIPAEQLGRLFERFYRADASRGEKSGFGLGLSIAAVIAQEHRGTLKAESGREGTRFVFCLPLKK